jgi:hypothetical protein
VLATGSFPYLFRGLWKLWLGRLVAVGSMLPAIVLCRSPHCWRFVGLGFLAKPRLVFCLAAGWFCGYPFWQSGLANVVPSNSPSWVLGCVAVGVAGLQSVFLWRGCRACQLWRAASRKSRSVFVSLAELVFPRCAAVRCGGLFPVRASVILMPNKPVKGTARRSGWQS